MALCTVREILSGLPRDKNCAVAACSAHNMEFAQGVIWAAEDDEVNYRASRTDPAQAIEFAERTGVDALAISIGNRHGFYKTPPRLDIDRLAAVRAAVSVPIVLHGGSDIHEEEIRKAVQGGINRRPDIGRLE